MQQRLERCRELLLDPQRRTATITELAYACGFNNPTHFGHAFKLRFGLTPRDCRQISSPSRPTMISPPNSCAASRR
jgi:AraC-like DNA-binding protein